ncbi:MAG: hypothetical protein JWO54_777 [Candidatus Saccharibacteria bacterium]|nr:hypothetical protein [Candidatus Saccharibacteria bacterium]MDB5181014.1 hypothetical protein [Candidatus Saccharibacteria bacterium]
MNGARLNKPNGRVPSFSAGHPSTLLNLFESFKQVSQLALSIPWRGCLANAPGAL